MVTIKKKIFEIAEVALNNLSPTANKLIIAPKWMSIVEGEISAISLNCDFDVGDAVKIIGNKEYVGIVNFERFTESTLTQLINTLTTEKEITVVTISDNPISCNVFIQLQMLAQNTLMATMSIVIIKSVHTTHGLFVIGKMVGV